MLLASSAEVLWRGAEAAGVADAMIEALSCPISEALHMRIRDALKDLLPASLLKVVRTQRAWLRAWWAEIVDCFRTRRQFADHALGADAVAMLRFACWPRKTILFFPEPPRRIFVEYKLCALLGYAITTNPNRPFDVAFKRQDATFFDPAVLHQIPTSRHRIINARSVDISKHAVSKAFAEVFGYVLDVDPLQYHGQIVEKSDENGTHDRFGARLPLAHSWRADAACVSQVSAHGPAVFQYECLGRSARAGPRVYTARIGADAVTGEKIGCGLRRMRCAQRYGYTAVRSGCQHHARGASERVTGT